MKNFTHYRSISTDFFLLRSIKALGSMNDTSRQFFIGSGDSNRAEYRFSMKIQQQTGYILIVRTLNRLTYPV